MLSGRHDPRANTTRTRRAAEARWAGAVGFVGLLPSGHTGPLDARRRVHPAGAAGSARHLGELIDDVRDLTGVVSGRIGLVDERRDLDRVVGEVVGPMAARKELDVEASVNPRA
jgi:signal transduction histidine kinase